LKELSPNREAEKNILITFCIEKPEQKKPAHENQICNPACNAPCNAERLTGRLQQPEAEYS
jgi:hypothetical protein